MTFYYDQNGQPFAMRYNDRMIFYVLNQQGDVVRLVNASGESYGIYTYDAWGNIQYMTDSRWMHDNPLRYRGYVYDEDTGLYYLQSRYYDPATGRFLNTDGLVSTGQGILGNNMFAYCLNNPVNSCDPCGTCFHRWDFWNDCEMCEQDSSTASYFDNITATVKSVVRNVDISAGIGQGIYAEFELFEVGIGIGMYGNYGTINYSQGVWSTGQELYFGITATLTSWLEFGAAEHYSRDSRNKEEHTSWIGYNDTQDTWTICSFAFYPLFAGVSFSVGFDIPTFLKEYDVIWGR